MYRDANTHAIVHLPFFFFVVGGGDLEKQLGVNLVCLSLYRLYDSVLKFQFSSCSMSICRRCSPLSYFYLSDSASVPLIFSTFQVKPTYS